MKIRQEKKEDYQEVYELVKEAFKTAKHSDGNEHELVKKLRNTDSFIPELSLVATDNDKIVAHILFTKATVGKRTVLALAPLSVHPVYQRKGIGLALIERGHAIATALGYDYSIVLGDAHYYSKIGYIPASVYEITAPFDISDDNFMAIQLNNSVEKIKGTIQYDTAFGIN